jgi:glycogen synthase
MKILIITNYYPPCNYGWGYMQLCEEIANGLFEKGHETHVLTSHYLHGDDSYIPYSVDRLLQIDPDWHSGRSAAWQFFIGRRKREGQAIEYLDRVVRNFKPDVILVFHGIGLPRLLLQAVEELIDVPSVYYLAGYLPELPDEYIEYWNKKPIRWKARLTKKWLAPIALRILARENKPVLLKFKNVICVSRYVRNRLLSRKLIPETAVVIYNGVDLSKFSPASSQKKELRSNGLRCLVAGSLNPDKGVEQTIQAFAILKSQNRLDHHSLSIMGHGSKEYLLYLSSERTHYELEDSVRFLPTVSRDMMPEILKQYDILILPSVYQEPIARAMQEAMASGLLVVGTTTGGTGELLVHMETGLSFTVGDPESLAKMILSASHDPLLRHRLSEAGRQAVIRNFDIRRTVNEIEKYLSQVAMK